MACVLGTSSIALAQQGDTAGDTSAEATAETQAPPEPDPPNVVQAREHLERGDALLDREDYDAALAEYERAYEVVGDHPFRYSILFNIGKAHEKRFRYDLALEYYRRYLDEGGPEAEDRPTVEATISALEGLLATIVVQVNVPEAEVWVDDRRVGTAPGEVLVPGGRHTVELRAEGYTAAQQEIQLPARARETLTFELVELAEEYTGISPAFFWTAVSLSAASLTVGAVFGFLTLNKRSQADEINDDPIDMLEGGRLEQIQGDIQDLALVADIFFGGALLFGGGAVVLALLTDWGDEDTEAESARLRLDPVLTGESGGLVLTGAF
jgi:tetratricopeptide (TPR) repeat protein